MSEKRNFLFRHFLKPEKKRLILLPKIFLYFIIFGVAFTAFALVKDSQRVSLQGNLKDILAVQTCVDTCVLDGITDCVSDTHVHTCGYFSAVNPCLSWSEAKLCSGVTTCGFGNCNDGQKPAWGCINGQCDYNCVDDIVCSGATPTPTPTSTCVNQCSSQATRCADSINIQTCGANSANSPCLGWENQTPCGGGTGCGSESCSNYQRPVWKCQSDKCSFDCVQDSTCGSATSDSGNNIICGDGICGSGENISCPEDCDRGDITVLVMGRKAGTNDWKDIVSASPRDKLQIQITVANRTKRDFSNATVTATLPDIIIYERNLIVGGETSRSDVRYGVDLGLFPSGEEKSITFNVSVSSGAKVKTEADISGAVQAENSAASDTLKTIVNSASNGAAWYIWLIAILVLAGIFVAFFILKARSQM